MANIKKIVAAAIMIAAALIVWSCKDQLDVKSRHSLNLGYGTEEAAPQPGDTIVDITYKDPTERFVEGGVEYSFIPVLIYSEKGEYPIDRVSTTFASEAYGTASQVFDGIKTHVYTTRNGQPVTVPSEETGTTWLETVQTTTQAYTAQNVSEDHNFGHQVGAKVAAMVCVYRHEGLDKELVVKFPAPGISISGEQLPNKKATNVPYNGKVFEADQYTWSWKVTATIEEGFRVAGEKYEDTREGENVAYFLLHEIDTRLDKEKTDYLVNIKSGERKLYQDPQKVHFELFTTDNGVEVDRKSYDFEEVFNITARGGENKTLASEEELKAVKITSFNKGKIKATDSGKDICSLTSFNFDDVIYVNDGNVITVEAIFEALGWNGNKFPYASTTDARTAVLTSSKNAVSTSSHPVYDVVLTLTFPVVYNNWDKADDTRTIVIKWQDDAVIPDNFTTKDENAKYEFDGKVNSEKNAFTKTVNKYSWTTNTYNNGVLVPNSGVPHEINMPFEVSVTNGTQVSITKDQRGKAVKVKAVDLGTLTNSDVDTEGGNKMRTSTRNATIIMDDGARISAKIVYGHTMKDGKDVFVYTEAKNLRVESVDMPNLDKERSSGDSEIYLVGLKLAFDCEEHGSVAATRANGDTRTEYLEAYYEQAVGDEYVPGTERTLVTVTPNGDEHKWLVEGFMTKTLSGEVRVDFKEGVYAPSLKGIDGTPIEVSNTDFEQKGSGYEGTGNGTYSQPATNGKENLTSQFLRNVGGDVVTTLDFPSGPKTVTIPATFEIRDLSPEITPTGSSNGFDTYRYTARVEGISTLGGKSITLPASANTQLKVKKSNNLVRQWNEPSMRPNGQGFDLTVVFYEEYEQDGVITKTLTDKMGRGFDPQHTDDMTVSEFANPETTSNGATGGTRGTYSSTTRVGNGSRNNVRSYWYDDVKTISYNGQSATFRGSATFDEVSSTVGSPSVQGKNNVYPLTNKAKMVYTVRCDNKSESETITNEVKWNIIVPIPDNIPDLIPGKIRSAAITCVPALGPETKDNDPLPYGAPNEYIDDDGIRHAVKCLTIVSSEGAVAIPFAMWDSNVAVPRESDIRSANFVSGSYGTDYNSGHDPKHNGVWVPAVAKDTSKGIAYYINGECVRSIRDETLNQWIWRNGNHSVFVTGYTFNVDNDGVLTVRYNGEVVLQCK